MAAQILDGVDYCGNPMTARDCAEAIRALKDTIPDGVICDAEPVAWIGSQHCLLVDATSLAIDRAEKAEAERDEARAELARLTTLRPIESWIFTSSRAATPAILWAKRDETWIRDPLFVEPTHWTPLPDVKE